MFQEKVKHINIRLYFIQDLVTNKEIELKYYSTHEQVINILTKLLLKDKFVYFRSRFVICNFEC